MNKRFINSTIFGTLLFGAAFLAACKDDVENYDNSVYLGETDKVEMILVDIEAGEVTKQGTVRTYLAKAQNSDVKVTYGVDGNLVARYNALNGDNAELLPAEFYEINDPSVVIKAGEVTASSLDINFINLDQLDYSKVYVLPLTIVSSDVDILDSQRNIYYVVKKASLVNWAVNMNNNNLYVDWENADVVNNLTKMSAEALIKVDGFADDRDSKISTIMGVEGKFLIRLGDSTIPSDQLQIAADGENVTSSDWKIKAGVWTHLAVTFDADTKTVQVYINGNKKTEKAFQNFAGPVNWGVRYAEETETARGFWIGYSYGDLRYLDGSMAECRIWNKVLTEEEINSANHFYRVAADSEGLVSYWKLNDGAGNTVKDYTANGNDATASNDLKWSNVNLPE